MPRPDVQVFHASPADNGLTLVSALRRWLKGPSWNQVRQLIRGRRVQIHGNLCVDEGRKLVNGDVVRVLPHAQSAPPREDDVEIRYLDAHVVVVEKPAGMTTLRHREEQDWPSRRKNRQLTLDEALPMILARRAKSPRPVKGQRPPVRAVHRLDRDTSGLMIFARTAAAERSLVAQFAAHTIHRRYVAIVHGKVEAQTIESRLVRDRGDGRRGSTKQPNIGQHAVTHVRPQEDLGAYTLIECRLETGRTHQIRIHLAEAGHFVCGDKVYSQPCFQKPLPDRSGAPRLALHAAELGFDHPVTGKRLKFEMQLPEDLQLFLKRLRRGTTAPTDDEPRRPTKRPE